MTSSAEITSALLDLRRRELRAIAIGASAGGIEALRMLLPALPASLEVPVVIVLHLAAEAKAEWSAVFSGCAVPVQEAEDKEPALPGAVYVAPPDYHLLLERLPDGASGLSLSIDEPVNLARPSIDVLFESAAWALGEGVLGVLLSGANADGAAGLAAIARGGGRCWVQSPETAVMAAMPRAGLLAVPEARILSLQQMSEAFRAWSKTGSS